MKGFVQDIEGLAVSNEEFRRVLYTAKHSQLVVMALKPKEEIGGRSPQARPVLPGRGGHRGGGSRWRPHADSGGFRGPRSGGGESQHHQFRQRSAEALHALCAAESSRRRRPPYARRRGVRQRALRRNYDGIDTRLGAGPIPQRLSRPASSALYARGLAMNEDQFKVTLASDGNAVTQWRDVVSDRNLSHHHHSPNRR